jgi:hypothetical protein
MTSLSNTDWITCLNSQILWIGDGQAGDGLMYLITGQRPKWQTIQKTTGRFLQGFDGWYQKNNK